MYADYEDELPSRAPLASNLGVNRVENPRRVELSRYLIVFQRFTLIRMNFLFTILKVSSIS